MNRNIQKYLAEASRSANQEYLNADGFIDEMNFAGNEDYFSADATPSGQDYQPVVKSRPYIVNISNASATAVANFDVLGAFYSLYPATGSWVNGSLVDNHCVISSGISNVTYQQLLAQSQINPFTVGETLITVINGASFQVTQPITVTTQDANGNLASSVLTPTIDPYQYQGAVVSLKQTFRIDGYTKLTFSTILPNMVMQLQFYPSDNINLARGLGGRPVSRQFGSPGIVRSSVAVIGSDSVKSRLG